MGEAADSLLGRARRAARNALLPLFDAADRDSMSDDERRSARASDPEFRRNDDRFQGEVDAHHREMMDDEKRDDAEKKRNAAGKARTTRGNQMAVRG